MHIIVVIGFVVFFAVHIYFHVFFVKLVRMRTSSREREIDNKKTCSSKIYANFAFFFSSLIKHKEHMQDCVYDLRNSIASYFYRFMLNKCCLSAKSRICTQYNFYRLVRLSYFSRNNSRFHIHPETAI